LFSLVEVSMSLEFYKVLHIFSVLLLFISLGTIAAAGISQDGRLRRLAGVAHGVALALILVAGFGLLAKLRMFGSIPGWVLIKFGLWFVLGLAVVPFRRRPQWTVWLWPLLPVIGGVAAWLAVTKPF
jgi:hypothetical protein